MQPHIMAEKQSVRENIHTFSLDYPSFDGPDQLCVHVVETDESTVLFGTGHESTTDEVVEIAREYDVEVVVPEHADGDHYGGIPALFAELDDPPEVAMGAVDVQWRSWQDDNPITDEIPVDHELEHGEVYWDILALHLPGHTPGNMAFIYDDPDEGSVLIAGDTVTGSDFSPLAEDDWTGDLAIVPAGRNTGGDANARESIRKLVYYDFESVIMTHGTNVLEDGKAEVRNLIHDLDRGMNRSPLML